jgi:hypothetical protein
VLRSVKQRDLLNAWLRAAQARRPAVIDLDIVRSPTGPRDADDVIEIG